MIRFKNIRKIINPKFLPLLPLAGLGILFTGKTTNAMFKNPRVNMPLCKSSSGRALTLPKIYTSNDKPISYTITQDERTILQSSNKNGLGASLRGFGDSITSTTTSSNLGSGLRQAGDRFNQ